jgi:predicted O-methyltransferase YrrM
MNAERRALAAEILAEAREHDAGLEDRLERYRVLEPDTAELLAFLVRATGARDVLEIGTSIGYSTLWLADAVDAVGGTLVSVEIDPERSRQARANLDRAGLGAELRVEDAAETLEPAPTRRGTSCSSTPSAPRTRATGRTSSARSGRAACSRRTTCCPTPTRSPTCSL